MVEFNTFFFSQIPISFLTGEAFFLVFFFFYSVYAPTADLHIKCYISSSQMKNPLVHSFLSGYTPLHSINTYMLPFCLQFSNI